MRLQRALEEVERFKALLQEQRMADKDQKDVSRSEYSRVFAGDYCNMSSECCSYYLVLVAQQKLHVLSTYTKSFKTRLCKDDCIAGNCIICATMYVSLYDK